MQALNGGRYSAELVTRGGDLDAGMALRNRVFRDGGDDRDGFDAVCDHLVVRHDAGAVVACARVLMLPNGRSIGASYAAQFYDLARLEAYAHPMAELGRFCVHPDHADADILRVIWGALTKLVDAAGIGMLFGCTSFAGATVLGREAALRYIGQNHAGPARFAPQVGFAKTVGLLDIEVADDARPVLQDIPPLLRTYLSMGAWVSDHVVIDDDLHTLHVFTGLEIAAIPEARKRRLRALSGG